MSELVARARELTEYLRQNADCWELSDLRLLDALASCGITLSEDPSGESSSAYLELIRMEMSVGETEEPSSDSSQPPR